MLRNIFYFSDERGRCPVEEFIKSLPLPERSKILAYIAELRRLGHDLRRPMADYVTQGLYVLRPKADRIFYFFYLKESAILVHAIRKKTDKLPERDIVLALSRKAYAEAQRKAGKLMEEDL